MFMQMKNIISSLFLLAGNVIFLSTARRAAEHFFFEISFKRFIYLFIYLLLFYFSWELVRRPAFSSSDTKTWIKMAIGRWSQPVCYAFLGE